LPIFGFRFARTKKECRKKPKPTQPKTLVSVSASVHLYLCVFILVLRHVITRGKRSQKIQRIQSVFRILWLAFFSSRLIITSQCVLCAFWLLCPLLTFVFKKFLNPLRFHSIRRMIFVGRPTKNYMFHFLWRLNSSPPRKK